MCRVLLCLEGAPESLCKSLSELGNFILSRTFVKRFPDGETYVRLQDVTTLKSGDVVVLTSLYPNQNDKIIELVLTLEALEGHGIEVRQLIIPYIAYSRQDKRFLEGEPISIKALMRILRSFGIRSIVTIDIHSYVEELEGVSIVNVLPHSFLIKAANINVDYVLAPDKGALKRAEKVARDLGLEFDHLDKYRDRVTGEIVVHEKELDVKNKSVVIVDDIVSTGGTLAKAIAALKKSGASRVYAAISHALLVGDAQSKLESSNIDMLITGNTINHTCNPRWMKVIDLAPLLRDFVTRSLQ